MGKSGMAEGRKKGGGEVIVSPRKPAIRSQSDVPPRARNQPSAHKGWKREIPRFEEKKRASPSREGSECKCLGHLEVIEWRMLPLDQVFIPTHTKRGGASLSKGKECHFRTP